VALLLVLPNNRRRVGHCKGGAGIMADDKLGDPAMAIALLGKDDEPSFPLLVNPS
jgi:hypothetical protein